MPGKQKPWIQLKSIDYQNIELTPDKYMELELTVTEAWLVFSMFL